MTATNKGISNVMLGIMLISLSTLCFVNVQGSSGPMASISNSTSNVTKSTPNVTKATIVTASSFNFSVSMSEVVIISVTPNATSTSMQPIRTSPVTPSPTPHSGGKGEGRRFDGLSFFGGMILGAVVCVILFFALKYYRAKKRSYHSL